MREMLAVTAALVGQGPYVPPVHLDVDLSAVHEIAPGSPVFSGNDHVWDVSQVLTDDDGAVTSLVLRRPGVLGRRVELPPERVTKVVGTVVHVDLSDAEIEELPDYEEPE